LFILLSFPAIFLFILLYSAYSIDTIFILGDGLTRLLLVLGGAGFEPEAAAQQPSALTTIVMPHPDKAKSQLDQQFLLF
jgi:hypothetical protein